MTLGNIPSQGEGRDAIERIARKHQATVRQVVLKWICKDEAFFTIPKSEQLAHIQENSQAASVELDADDLRTIDHFFPLPDRDQPLATG